MYISLSEGIAEGVAEGVVESMAECMLWLTIRYDRRHGYATLFV